MIPNFKRWPRRNLNCYDCDETTAHLRWPSSHDRWICARCGRSRLGGDAKDEESRGDAKEITKEDIWGKK